MSTQATITRSELIEILVEQQPHLAHRDVELAVKAMLERLSDSFTEGERIEIRGFGKLFFALPRSASRSKSKNRRVCVCGRKVFTTL